MGLELARQPVRGGDVERLIDADAAARVEFNRHVRPILAEKCFACHGADAERREADLRLDTADGAFADRNGVPAIVPGSVDSSELWRRVTSESEDERMPPAGSDKTLSDDELQLLRTWIEQGARYQGHWAFEPLVEPPRPARSPSASRQNAIDDFLDAGIQEAGLSIAPEASRQVLIRRVAFTLTGLPPTLDQQRQYFNDSSAGAYERMVDRYLESPHFGEEMARHWLDLARYADTHGMHLDNERQMWAYRDWVVRAFNMNQPFDQFTIEQLAGDLLPNPTQSQLVATGYNRCNVTTGEGGSIDEEWIFRYAVDRTSTTVQTWLGLTAGCAVCHDHKFDPISQREFYSLYAFFNSASDPAMDGNVLLTPPVVRLETPEVAARLAELEKQIDAPREELRAAAAELNYADPGGDDVETSFDAWWRAAGSIADQLPEDLREVAKAGPTAGRDEREVRRLRDHYLHHHCRLTRERLGPLADRLKVLSDERNALNESVPSSFIFRDLDKPRESFVMKRGAYDQPGERVEPGVPAFLPPLQPSSPGARLNRLHLARWLVSDENPLTARVAVNRYWQQVFGVGLVKTSYDLGTQGELPSHPELLDWLAVDFRNSGWNVKRLMRMMVTSAAFRRESMVDERSLALDPENRLLARGPRGRLDAEQIRDAALAVSGLIDLRMGGKGAKPYQPDNIWEPVGFVGSNTRFYQRDTGAALYRRSIYTFLKRTAPPPFMANFDAPSREQFCSRRERGNTPLQALQLMNDVQHVEAARALASRMILQGGPTTAERIDFAFRLLVARPAEPGEVEVVSQQLQRHLDRYLNDPDAARRLIELGESQPPPAIDSAELAAYTLVANMILNLDESLTRN